MKRQTAVFSHYFNRLSMLAVAILAVLPYLRALTFGFFNDDPTGDLAWLESQSWWQLFISAAGYGYYRPVAFSLRKALHALLGYSDLAFHGFSLLLHATNVALVWWLAAHLTGKRAYGWLAALVFAAVPFHYEAVAYVAAMVHPLVLFWTLLTLWLYARWRETADSRPYFLAHLTLILGLFSHENSLFIPPALLGYEWVASERPSLRTLVRRLWPFAVAPVLFLVLWFTVPKSGQQTLPTLATVSANLLPFLQTLVYPLLPVVGWETAVAHPLVLLSITTIIVLGLLAWRVGHWRLWLLALGWFLLSSTPSVLFLDNGYILGSPRLNYLPSVGVALLWGLPALAVARLRHSGLQLGLTAALALGIALPPLPLIACEMDFYAATTAIVEQMAAIATHAPRDEELVFVNVPFFYSSYAEHPDGCPNPYPWTPVGAVVVPGYANVADFVRINGGPARPARSVAVAAYAPGWATHGEENSVDRLRALVGNTAVFVFDLNRRTFFNLSQAWQPDAARQETAAVFGQAIGLGETAVTPTETTLNVTLHWQAIAEPAQNYTVFVHLYDTNGALVAQNDSPPAHNYVPTLFWQPGDLIRDSHTLQLPSSLPPGRYRLAAGLYDPVTGERLSVTAGEQSGANDDFTIEVLELE